MADEILKLRTENNDLKRKLDEIVGKLEGQIAELKDKVEDLEEQKAKLMEQIEKMNEEKSHENSLNSNQPKTSVDESAGDLTLDAEEQKISGKRVPNWLIEVLEWINRLEMADSALSISCWTFNQFCFPKLHKNVKTHKMPCLEFFPARIEPGNVRALLRANNQIIPIASILPPDYIVGIQGIILKFIDDQVLMFFKEIANLVHNIRFFPTTNLPKMDKKLLASMQALLNLLRSKICSLQFYYSGWNLSKFNKLFSDIIDSVQPLIFIGSSNLDMDLLLHLFGKQQKNTVKKMLKLQILDREFLNTLIDRIKKDFSSSNSPSTFFCFIYWWTFDEFMMENERTNECLTIYEKNDPRDDFPLCYLARFTKGEEYWKEEGEKKINNADYSSLPFIDISL